MNQVISFIDVIKSSFRIVKKYRFKVILSYLLWFITFWIPYLNIGTTIGLKKMIVKMSHGDSFSPLDIFDSENRKNIDIFLILWFISSNLIIIASFVFLFFPGYVMYFALSQIYLLFIDKNLGAMESIRESYRITYGEKWQILFSKFLGNIGIYILGSIIISIIYFAIYNSLAQFMDWWDLYRLMRWVIQPLMVLIFISFIFAFNASMNAYIYSKLRDK